MIKHYTLEQSEEWDNIVKSFENYDVYYLSGYVKAFALHGDGEPMLVYFESKQKPKTRAINVIIRRDVADQDEFKGILNKGEYFDSTTPYGYGSFIIEGENVEELENEYKKFCYKQKIICEFVRFHPLLENWNKLEDFYETTLLGNTVYIDTTSEETIWQNMISQCRNKIRKATKNGLKVYWGRYPEIIDDFMAIYNETMDKDNATDYYYFKRDFYESILDDLKDQAMWFYAKKDDEIVASAIFMFCNGNVHYHLSGAKREYQKFAPINLILAEAALWACNHGYKKLHMGGGLGAQEDDLYKFKKSFNRQEDAQFYIGKRIWNQEKYDYLVNNRIGLDQNCSYFPLYRG